MKKRILVFGDSNTWGYTPVKKTRYDEEIRYTKRMEKILGDEYEVIEAGLNGRTTVFYDPFEPLAIGIDYLPMLLDQEKPLELLVIHLGTNDLKFADARHSARGAGRLVQIAKHFDAGDQRSSLTFKNGPKILLVAPIHVGENLTRISPYTTLLPGAYEESLKFSSEFKKIAEDEKVEFFDASAVAGPSEADCIHMMPEGHAALAVAMAAKIKEILE